MVCTRPIWAGTASGVLNAARQVGGALGVAVYGALAAAPDTLAAIAGVRTSAILSGLLLAAASVLGPALALQTRKV